MAKSTAGDLPDPNGRNADKKYYRSGQLSAIQRPRGELGKSTNIPVPNFRADDRSTNKYYQEGGSTSQPVTTAARGLRQARQMQPVKQLPLPTRRQQGGKFVIREADDVRPVCEAVVAQLLDSTTEEVRIHVLGDSGLAMRVRSYLDMQVTRERITENQYRDVVISVAGSTAATPVPPPPVVAETRTPEQIFGDPGLAEANVVSEPEEAIEDIGDFLSSHRDDDSDMPPPAPTVASEVVIRDGATDEIIDKVDGEDWVAEAEQQAAGSDDDFLAEPGTVKTTSTDPLWSLPEKVAQPKPVPSQPKKGKRNK